MKRTFSFLTLPLISITNLLAHALWIETSAVGKAGQKQTVKIVYSEPDDKPEKLADWYSDVKEFKLWFTTPDRKKVKLATVASDDHFTSEFTPEKDGVCTLSISKAANELGGSTIYQFNTGGIVKVGISLVGNDSSFNGNEIKNKNITSDTNGMAAFTPIWPGTYKIEAS